MLSIPPTGYTLSGNCIFDITGEWQKTWSHIVQTIMPLQVWTCKVSKQRHSTESWQETPCTNTKRYQKTGSQTSLRCTCALRAVIRYICICMYVPRDQSANRSIPVCELTEQQQIYRLACNQQIMQCTPLKYLMCHLQISQRKRYNPQITHCEGNNLQIAQHAFGILQMTLCLISVQKTYLCDQCNTI